VINGASCYRSAPAYETDCHAEALAETADAEGLGGALNVVSGIIVDQGIKLHRQLGPGLLESVYEELLAAMLTAAGLFVERQKKIDFEFNGLRFERGFTVDLLVERLVVVELKSVERLAPVHTKQLLTYLRLLHLPIGLLMNFGEATMRQGIKRVANNYRSPRLAVYASASA
jgi:iron complex transport system substrate-binding protein